MVRESIKKTKLGMRLVTRSEMQRTKQGIRCGSMLVKHKTAQTFQAFLKTLVLILRRCIVMNKAKNAISVFSFGLATVFSSATLSQPIYIEKKMPEISDFSALNGKHHIPMKCDDCSTFSVINGVLSSNGFGGLWTTEKSYDVSNGGKLILEVNVRLHIDSNKSHERGSELIVGFSDNLRPWGDPEADALTFRIGCDNKENNFLVVVRDKMYGNYLSNSSRYILPPEQWQTVRIVLTSEKISAYVEDKEIVQADLRQSSFPRKGHIGILSYRKVTSEVKSLRIYQ